MNRFWRWTTEHRVELEIREEEIKSSSLLVYLHYMSCI